MYCRRVAHRGWGPGPILIADDIVDVDIQALGITVTMNNRVGIIGCGWVGTSVALSTLQSGVADELWLHDLRADLAEGEAMDLAHGAAF